LNLFEFIKPKLKTYLFTKAHDHKIMTKLAQKLI